MRAHGPNMARMTDFTRITTPTRLDDTSFQADIPDGWQQGRGAFGGLVLANLVRAIDAVDADGERALRSLTAEICGPVLPGLATIHVTRLRTGTGVSTLAARMEQGGEVLAHAVGIRGRLRSGDTDFCDIAPPPMPAWRDVPPVQLGGGPFPVFAQHFEFRVSGPPPFTGRAEPVASGWIRPRDPGPARDAAYVTACADGWWPSILARLPAPRPVATIAFTLELFGDLEGLDPEAPLFHDARGFVSRGGYTVETRQLWGEDGRLVSRNHQTLAIIK